MIGAVLAVVAAAAAADVAGAARGESSPPADGGTFVDIIPADPGNLDPQMSVFVTTANVNAFAYDTLLYPTPDGELVSGLAESWEETPTSVTYTLKEGITCSRRLAADRLDRRRQLPIRRRPEQPVAVAGDLRPTRDHRRGRRRGTHGHVDERAAGAVLPSVHRAQPVHRLRERAGGPLVARGGHRRDRAVRPRGGRAQRPLHVPRS